MIEKLPQKPAQIKSFYQRVNRKKNENRKRNQTSFWHRDALAAPGEIRSAFVSRLGSRIRGNNLDIVNGSIAHPAKVARKPSPLGEPWPD